MIVTFTVGATRGLAGGGVELLRPWTTATITTTSATIATIAMSRRIRNTLPPRMPVQPARKQVCGGAGVLARPRLGAVAVTLRHTRREALVVELNGDALQAL